MHQVWKAEVNAKSLPTLLSILSSETDKVSLNFDRPGNPRDPILFTPPVLGSQALAGVTGTDWRYGFRPSEPSPAQALPLMGREWTGNTVQLPEALPGSNEKLFFSECLLHLGNVTTGQSPQEGSFNKGHCPPILLSIVLTGVLQLR